ncbi:hypothetical protein [Mucilaginibacter terrae]|uniref:Alpha/beta hydrolase n=1 Tax=Mucilaginibacter terrae TaxID=1955052 RepID=A0ABU3GN20_9SPHI|nr:hypothetical protein [Mucilaginibacter terrae]MDT3401175.1 hypothetical protein [Mucilaginibacter terrae]
MRSHYIRFVIWIALLFPIHQEAKCAIWQWSVSVNYATKYGRDSKAYLWIPEKCKRVRAIIFAQNNMEEQSILENKRFREEMSKLGIAEVWVSPGFDLSFDFQQGAGDIYRNIMRDLGTTSGYTELKYVPFIGLGHSAAASSPYYMAAWCPEKAIAAISVSGQWPYFRAKNFAPDVWGSKNIDFIPCLETMGEYEAAVIWSAEGLKQRADHPNLPLSMLACPGEGHFNATQEKIDFLAFYIAKALKFRLPKNYNERSESLSKVDPTVTGWLMEKWSGDKDLNLKAAPVKTYAGSKAEAFWFFDKETVSAVRKYQRRFSGLKTPLIGYLQNDTIIKQENTHNQIRLAFDPMSDGITFHVKPFFYDRVPGGSPRPGSWSGQPEGTPISFPIAAGLTVERITGPVIKINDSTFRVEPQYGFDKTERGYEAWFAAVFKGDAYFRSAVQQAKMQLRPRNVLGEDQTITFLPIPNLNRKSKHVKPQALASSGLTVHFSVLEGPAIVKDNYIHLQPIPPNAKFPVKVVVEAWQYGSSKGHKVKTAEPIQQTFYIL